MGEGSLLGVRRRPELGWGGGLKGYKAVVLTNSKEVSNKTYSLL